MFSSKALSWISIVATVCLLLLIVFQTMEWMFYRAAPSVWPGSP